MVTGEDTGVIIITATEDHIQPIIVLMVVGVITGVDIGVGVTTTDNFMHGKLIG